MQTVPRLLEKFTPNNYKLNLKLKRIERVFEGSVLITGKSNENTDSIKLHSKELDILSVKINGNMCNHNFGKFDELSINFDTRKDETYEILINFSGKITDAMHGMYPCYFEHDNQKKELLATQFESHHAREVFPCIDEPAAKATYDLTLNTECDITVLGNMPILDQTQDSDRLITTFETSPIMSSYLLAFVVGELHKKSAKTKNGVDVNVWATPAQSPESLDFALDIATRSIEFYDKYFATPYPLTKCDHVALPDFSSGAMENWGLITYREMALLADPKDSSIADKRYIATVIAHEISHQWFGNLVTMQWWNDLWLNESFASLVEYTAVNALEPSWDVWLDFASYDSILALKRDSVAGVQSVQTDVNHPDEISTLFDGAIVYAKGARLMQMLEKYIGEENFRLGLCNYFKKYAYKNTTANDLWNEFSAVSGLDISSFMNTWISQPGYPVLHAKYTNQQIQLSQERLSTNQNNIDDTLWPIPLNSNEDSYPRLFEQKDITLPAVNPENLRFNIGSFSHFITNYDDGLLSNIINNLKAGKFTSVDRLQILNEQNLLANAGVISMAKLVPLLASYDDENIESVWNIIASSLYELRKYVADNKPAEEKLRELAYSLAEKQYSRLGWTAKINEPAADTKLRGLILGLVLYSENKQAEKIANEMFNSTSVENLDPEIRSLLISNAVKHETDYSVVQKIINCYIKTSSVSLQQDICAGLTSVEDPEIAKCLLDITKDPSMIRPQDSFRWIIYLLRNKYTKTLTWNWIKENWNWIQKTFEGDKSYEEYPRYIASSMFTRELLDEYKKFFVPMIETPGLTRVINMGINEINDRITAIERDSNAVTDALLNI